MYGRSRLGAARGADLTAKYQVRTDGPNPVKPETCDGSGGFTFNQQLAPRTALHLLHAQPESLAAWGSAQIRVTASCSRTSGDLRKSNFQAEKAQGNSIQSWGLGLGVATPHASGAMDLRGALT